MKKFLTDMHTHSTYSHDGQNTLAEMLEAAQKLGVDFYGVSEHFDYDYDLSLMSEELAKSLIDAEPEEYFHGARHLQEAYEGVMNVAIGAEFGYSSLESVKQKYMETYEKYRPDFVINSVHGANGVDFAYTELTGEKEEVYKEYLRLIRESLDAPYPYDIVGHIGYVARYVNYADRSLSLQEFGAEIDDILRTVIAKNKILEVNSSNKGLENRTIPAREIIERYYALGGRKISYGSDSHFIERIMDKRDEVMEMLKEIGFTYLTVPFRGEHIKVEI